MLAIVLAVVLTAALFVAQRHRMISRGAQLGAMSHHWVAAHNASRQPSNL